MSFRNILEGITQWIEIHCIWQSWNCNYQNWHSKFFRTQIPVFFYLITAIFSSSFALFRHGELWSRIWSGSRAWWIWPFNYILTNIGAKSFWEYFSFFLQAVYELEYTSSSIIRPEVCGLYLKEVNIKEQVVMGVVRCTFY